MYNQDQQSAVLNEPKITMAQNIKDQFQELNDRQTKLLSAIEDRLHDLVNKRNAPVPEQQNKIAEKTISDFNSTLLTELNKMRNQTNRLEDIYSHLQSII